MSDFAFFSLPLYGILYFCQCRLVAVCKQGEERDKALKEIKDIKASTLKSLISLSSPQHKTKSPTLVGSGT